MRRLVVMAVVALLTTLVPWTPVPGAGATSVDAAAAEADFVGRINDLRTSKGLPPLAVDAELVGLGRRWAATMAGADRIWHNPDLAGSVGAPWVKLGENVGVGMSVDRLFQAFLASPSHYRNLVDPEFTHLGVGVIVGRDGALFTAHQFMKLAPAAAAPAPAAPAPGRAGPAPARVTVVLDQLRALDAA